MDAVHRYEGTVNQVLGDGIMALFGAPLAHEDHAMRACYAAVSMQDAIGRYAEELRREPGPRRADPRRAQFRRSRRPLDRQRPAHGLHGGRPDHSPGRTRGAARPPGNDARHRQHASPGGGVRRGHGAWTRAVEGVGGPGRDLRARARARPLRSRLRAAAAHGLTRFVGRTVEIEQLQRALERARDGHGQVVAVIGEPGVGKSRLFFEFVAFPPRRRAGSCSRASPSRTARATAYLPVIDLLKTYFQIADRDDARTIRAKVTGHVLTLDEALRDTIAAAPRAARRAPRGRRASRRSIRRSAGSGRSTPSSACSSARARCGLCSSSSRTSTGSIPRRRRFSIASSTVFRRTGSSS